MEKPGNQLVAWGIFVFSVGTLAYVVNHEGGVANEVVAAYLQAVGSVLAIIAAIWVAHGEARREREARRQNLCERLEILAHMGCLLAYLTDKLRIRVDGEHSEAVASTRLKNSINYLDAFPVTEMGPAAIDALNLSSQANHLLISWDNWTSVVKKTGIIYDADHVTSLRDGRSASVVREDAAMIEATARRLVLIWMENKNGAAPSQTIVDKKFEELRTQVSKL